MASEHRFETQLIYAANQTVSRPVYIVYNLRSTRHALKHNTITSDLLLENM